MVRETPIGWRAFWEDRFGISEVAEAAAAHPSSHINREARGKSFRCIVGMYPPAPAV